MFLGFLAFVTLCGIALSGQILAYKTQVAAAPIGDLVRELQRLKFSADRSPEAQQSVDAYRQGIAYIEKKDLDKAIQSIEESLSKIPTLSAEYTLANLYREKGDEQHAREHAQKASRLATERGNALDQVKADRLLQEISAGGSERVDEQARSGATLTPRTGKPIRAGADSYTFSENKLPPEWIMMNADPQKWVMQPRQKSLLIITQTGSFSDSKTSKNRLTLNRALPSNDFEVIVTASIQIQGAGNELGVVLFKDDQNYIFVKFSGEPWGYNIDRTARFGKIFVGEGGGSLVNDRRGFGKAEQAEPILLKIDRRGNQYDGYYSYAEGRDQKVDEVKWTKMGTLPWINFDGKLVLYAANFKDAPEVAAEFYSVQIRPK